MYKESRYLIMRRLSRSEGVLCVLLLASVSANVVLASGSELKTESHGNKVDPNVSLVRPYAPERVKPDVAANRTLTVINQKVFEPSPNNVTAQLVNVTDASEDGLPEFYKVWISVENPSGSQITRVYTRKGGEVSFFNIPRYLGEDWRGSSYIR